MHLAGENFLLVEKLINEGDLERNLQGTLYQTISLNVRKVIENSLALVVEFFAAIILEFHWQ